MKPWILLEVSLWAPSVFGQTPEEWVALGERVHGGFGTRIALGAWNRGRDARGPFDVVFAADESLLFSRVTECEEH
jgi:hypothetical protein